MLLSEKKFLPCYLIDREFLKNKHVMDTTRDLLIRNKFIIHRVQYIQRQANATLSQQYMSGFTELGTTLKCMIWYFSSLSFNRRNLNWLSFTCQISLPHQYVTTMQIAITINCKYSQIRNSCTNKNLPSSYIHHKQHRNNILEIKIQKFYILHGHRVA